MMCIHCLRDSLTQQEPLARVLSPKAKPMLCVASAPDSPMHCEFPFALCSSPPDEKEGAATEGTEGKVVQGDGNEHIEQEESGEDVKRESDVIHDQTGETPEGMATEGEDDDTSTSSGPLIVAHHVCTGPEGLPPADVVSLSSQEGVSVARGDKELSHIISPPETFSCGDSATPTPQLETESMASGTITPRNSPCGGTNTPISPVSPRPQSSKDTTPPPEVCQSSYVIRKLSKGDRSLSKF